MPSSDTTMDLHLRGDLPGQGQGCRLVMPWCDTEAMTAHLKEISATVDPGAHAVVMLDQAVGGACRTWRLETRYCGGVRRQPERRSTKAKAAMIKRPHLLAGALAMIVAQPAYADLTILRCHGENVDTHEAQDIGVALDLEARRVVDFGQGEGVETTDFTATTIKAKLDPDSGRKSTHFRIRIKRLDGSFTLISREDQTDGPPALETRVKGTCEAAKRKF